MNKSKKITKAVVVNPEKKHEKLVSSKFLTITSIVFVVILVGALIFDQFYESTYITLDGEKYHFKDLSYYFYQTEAQYDYYDQMFGGSGAYWDMSYDETTGTTMRDIAKQEAIETALYNEVLYNQAIEEGYTLTDAEKLTIESNVDTLTAQTLSEAVITKNGFTEDYLTEITSKNTLATRYRQDKIEALDIDDEGIKASIAFEDYKQYDIEYLVVTTKTTDAEGKTVELSEADQAAALEKINSLYASAKTTEDWSTLIAEDDETAKYLEDSFIETDTTFDDEFEASIIAMENNAISEVYETESGYYVVRMLDNNSSESYDNAVEEAITKAENEGFSELYSQILGAHEYKINQSAMKSLTMGSLTLTE